MAALAGARVELPLAPSLLLSAATAAATTLGAAGLLDAGSASGLPCAFAAVSGVDCPLCGLTHAVGALGGGDVAGALALHPLAPLAVALAVAAPLSAARSGRVAARAGALWLLLAIVLATWLLRLPA